jgi:hypothetical protein
MKIDTRGFNFCRKVNEFKKKIALVEGKRKVKNEKFKFSIAFSCDI